MSEIWYVKVRTWTEILGYARHYYARIQRRQVRTTGTCPECHWGNCHNSSCSKYVHDIEVDREIDQETADRLNTEDQSFTYKAGDTSGRFWDQEAAEAAAIGIWMAHPDRKEGDLLVVGDIGYVEPHKPLAGSPEAMAKLQDMWTRFEPLNGTSADDWKPEMDDELIAFSSEWQAFEHDFTAAES